jgi:hypothetical protein
LKDTCEAGNERVQDSREGSTQDANRKIVVLPLNFSSKLKRIPIDIIGLNFGNLIVTQLQREPACRRFKIAAVCDRDCAKVERKAQEWGVQAYHDLDSLLANEAIPPVGLFTAPREVMVAMSRAEHSNRTGRVRSGSPSASHPIPLL